ncbi:LytR family transcriptional regulator [filamentous cyanobacterium CCP5]|nr:LytR family transcriptional regulator [filamentous cyanobacterium CCP5]
MPPADSQPGPKPPKPDSTGASSPSVGDLSENDVATLAAPVTTVYLPPQQPRWRRWLRRGAWAGAFIGTATLSAIGGGLLGLWVPLPTPEEPTKVQAGLGELWQTGFRYQVARPVNILVMGIDEVPGVDENSEAIFTGRTDTLLLVRIDPEAHTVNLLSIPRDTRVTIPGYGIDKINQANVEGGPELVAQTISYNFGDIPVDRYVRVSTGAFKEIVDLVGGVEVLVPKRMIYEDRTQDLHIDLYPGLQTLDGDQAEQFARFRKDANGDIGRVQRQQMLLDALRDRLKDPRVITQLPQGMGILQRYIDTNLTLEEMLALANFGLDLQGDDFRMVMLPGRFSSRQEYIASYWIPDRNAISEVMADHFQVDALATLAENREQTSVWDMHIAVQNAAANPNVAAEMAQQLRSEGFHNVYVIQDWPATQAQTQVIAQRGDLDSARSLTSILGIGRAIAESTGDLQSDLTIRIGNDWLEADRQAPDEPSP